MYKVDTHIVSVLRHRTANDSTNTVTMNTDITTAAAVVFVVFVVVVTVVVDELVVVFKFVVLVITVAV